MTLLTPETKISPMMEQWERCKKSSPNTLLLFRLGDFYEAFHQDAQVLAKELSITLTKRQEIPMAGVPFHASEGYIDKLVAKGYSIAIAEQMEDPKATKGLVKREIVRVITPGTVVNSTLLSDKTNNFLASLSQVNNTFGLSILDVTTADFRALEFEDPKQLLDELCRLGPKEILLSRKWKKDHPQLIEEMEHHFHPTFNPQDDWYFEHQCASDTLLRHFHVHNLDGFGLKAMTAAINAAGALLYYVKENLNLVVTHIQSLKAEHTSDYMLLDRSTQRNLELIEPLQEGKKQHTLLYLLDQTSTPMGGRLLKKWLIHPLLSVEKIRERQLVIQAFHSNWIVIESLKSHLESIFDLERLIMRIETGYATPKDVAALGSSLKQVAPLFDGLTQFSSPLIDIDQLQLGSVSQLVDMIEKALGDNPPLRLTDGDIFKNGYHQELDEQRALKADSHSWIAAYQNTLRESTQIKTLKVGYTQAFGFYIEITRAQSDRIPAHFQRRQTLVNAERFITDELKAYEYKILHAEERILALEYDLFHALRKQVASEAPQIRAVAQSIARIDTLIALAQVAKERHYTCPIIDTSGVFEIKEGRHPVIEASLKGESFIPNDLYLDQKDNRLMLITGPNMAGKSTYIRQTALIAILAQIGSFVPAKRAHIGIIDKVFSRIGANDDLSRGQSTFMVEMAETANILHHATAHSLVILDEIGRGTSTYDGVSIAWAVAEYLLTEKGKTAKTLFATHYWELTSLEQHIPGAVNYNVAVHESPTGITFLRKIIKGGTDKSYGIHVAKLAGLPQSVLFRAQEILLKLEKNTNKTPSSKIKIETNAQLSFLHAL